MDQDETDRAADAMKKVESRLPRWKVVSEAETAMEYYKWVEEIPHIKFPSDWFVKIIPPFAGAIVRFLVRENIESERVSVYLDCYDMLGCNGEPYWEVHPYNEDIFRCKMQDTEALLEAISYSLKKVKQEQTI